MESSPLLSTGIRLKSGGEIKNRQSCSPKPPPPIPWQRSRGSSLRHPPRCIPPSGFALALAGEDAKEPGGVRGLAEP